MLFPQVLLGLAATAAAIDIRYHFTNNCGGNFVECVNINPDRCCAASAVSLGFVAIPSNWRIRCRGWRGGNCGGNPDATAYSAGSTSVCIQSSGFLYNSANYNFVNRRRAAAAAATLGEVEEGGGQCSSSGGEGAEEEGAAAVEVGRKCTSVQKPDALVLADGTRYSLVGLEGAPLDKLLGLASNGTVSAAEDVPEEFKALAVV